jgi:hypothetical protein
MPQCRTIEFWREVRGLVERGLSLKKASEQFGLSYSNLSQRAKIEGWKLVWRGRPRTMDLPDGRRRVEMAKEQQGWDTKQAELSLEARVAVFDTKKAKLVAQKILAQHSCRMKVALSELVVQTAEDLRSADIRPKDRALAMVALKTVSDRLYGWDREPDIAKMQQAISPQGPAINLSIIATSPAELKALGEPKRDSLDGFRPKVEGKEVLKGCAEEDHEQAGRSSPESQPQKAFSVQEQAASGGTVTKETVAPCLAAEECVQGEAPFCPATQKPAARLKALEQASAEHRRANWEKYRYAK